jgi:hypothetical protein
VRFFVGITDRDWFEFLSRMDVNFWQPSGQQQFRALQIGEPFLFKLHSPDDLQFAKSSCTTLKGFLSPWRRFFGLGLHAGSWIRENSRRERGLCLVGFQKGIWLSEKQLLNLRCHRITMVQATESRKGLNLASYLWEIPVEGSGRVSTDLGIFLKSDGLKYALLFSTRICRSRIESCCEPCR